MIIRPYCMTRERAFDPDEKFLQGCRGYLQPDACGAYGAFFKDPKARVRLWFMQGGIFRKDWNPIRPEWAGLFADRSVVSSGEASTISIN
jgi:hypothetical protein